MPPEATSLLHAQLPQLQHGQYTRDRCVVVSFKAWAIVSQLAVTRVPRRPHAGDVPGPRVHELRTQWLRKILFAPMMVRLSPM
jgi:hypothetical protein